MAALRGVKQKRKEQSEYFFDYSLLFIVLFLLGFGMVMIYSASSYEAFQEFGDTAYYLKKQLTAVVIGLVLMIIVMIMNAVHINTRANKVVEGCDGCCASCAQSCGTKEGGTEK